MGDRQPDRDHSKSHSVSGSEIWPRLEDGQELGVGWNQPKVASLCCAPEGGRSSENNTLRQGVPCGHGSPCPACLLSPSRWPWKALSVAVTCQLGGIVTMPFILPASSVPEAAETTEKLKIQLLVNTPPKPVLRDTEASVCWARPASLHLF